MVKNIKETIKRNIRAGCTLATAPAARSQSFRRNNTEDRLNSSDPGPFLRVVNNNNPASILRRSFSHNPEEAVNRRTSLESDSTLSSASATDTESISSARERKITLKKKNKTVSPLPNESTQVNL